MWRRSAVIVSRKTRHSAKIRLLRSVPWRLARTVRTFYRPTGIFFPELHLVREQRPTLPVPHSGRISPVPHQICPTRNSPHRNSAPSELAALASAPIEASPHQDLPSDRCPSASDAHPFRSGRHARTENANSNDRCPSASKTRSSEAPDMHVSPQNANSTTDARPRRRPVLSEAPDMHAAPANSNDECRSRRYPFFRNTRHARLFPECKFDNRCQSASETRSFRSGRHAHLPLRMRIPTGRFRG